MNKFCADYKDDSKFAESLFLNCERGESDFKKKLPKNYFQFLCHEDNSNPQSYFQLKQAFTQKLSSIYQVDFVNVSPEYFFFL